jgi:hypothetical protein
LLDGASEHVLAARCLRDDSLRRSRETSPKTHPELRRYREAGASSAALFAFPEREIGSDAFFESELMADYSQAVLLEGDSPLAFVDLAASVAPPLPAGNALLVRRPRDHAQEERDKADALERLLRQPDGVAALLGQMGGATLASFARQRPELLGKTRADLIAGITEVRGAPAAKPTEHWAITDGYEGIERAQLVVINARGAADRERAEALAEEVARLRSDGDVLHDIFGPSGTKTPITIVVANLADRKDAGRKKALSRVRRALRAGVDA